MGVVSSAHIKIPLDKIFIVLLIEISKIQSEDTAYMQKSAESKINDIWSKYWPANKFQPRSIGLAFLVTANESTWITVVGIIVSDLFQEVHCYRNPVT